MTVAEHDGGGGFLEQSARFAALWSERPAAQTPQRTGEGEGEAETEAEAEASARAEAARRAEAHAKAKAGAEGSGPLMVPGRNHYDVVLDLADEESALSRALLALIHSTDRTPGRASGRTPSPLLARPSVR